MSLANLLTNAAAQAQSTLAQLQGMPAGGDGNLLSPEGKSYTSVPRAASAFERAEAERYMTSHGFTDSSVQIHTLTRDQFTEAPLSWRRRDVTLLNPLPVQKALVASLSTDDPLHYVLVLICYQPAG